MNSLIYYCLLSNLILSDDEPKPKYQPSIKSTYNVAKCNKNNGVASVEYKREYDTENSVYKTKFVIEFPAAPKTLERRSVLAVPASTETSVAPAVPASTETSVAPAVPAVPASTETSVVPSSGNAVLGQSSQSSCLYGAFINYDNRFYIVSTESNTQALECQFADDTLSNCKKFGGFNYTNGKFELTFDQTHLYHKKGSAENLNMTQTYKAVVKHLKKPQYPNLENNGSSSDTLKIQDFIKYDATFMNSANGLSSSVLLSSALVFAGAMASQFF